MGIMSQSPTGNQKSVAQAGIGYFQTRTFQRDTFALGSDFIAALFDNAVNNCIELFLGFLGAVQLATQDADLVCRGAGIEALEGLAAGEISICAGAEFFAASIQGGLPTRFIIIDTKIVGFIDAGDEVVPGQQCFN